MRLASFGGVTRTGAAQPSPACGRRRTLCVTRVVRNGYVAHQRTQRNRLDQAGGGVPLRGVRRVGAGGVVQWGGVEAGGGGAGAPPATPPPHEGGGGAGPPLAGDGGVQCVQRGYG